MRVNFQYAKNFKDTFSIEMLISITPNEVSSVNLCAHVSFMVEPE